MQLYICWRQGRWCVSSAFRMTQGGRGYDAVANWRTLEAEARAAIENARQGGPFVYPCPPDLAQRALVIVPDQPAPPDLDTLRTIQRSLFDGWLKEAN